MHLDMVPCNRTRAFRRTASDAYAPAAKNPLLFSQLPNSICTISISSDRIQRPHPAWKVCPRGRTARIHAPVTAPTTALAWAKKVRRCSKFQPWAFQTEILYPVPGRPQRPQRPQRCGFLSLFPLFFSQSGAAYKSAHVRKITCRTRHFFLAMQISDITGQLLSAISRPNPGDIIFTTSANLTKPHWLILARPRPYCRKAIGLNPRLGS